MDSALHRRCPVRQLSLAGSSGDLTASHRFPLSHNQGGCENFLVQGYVLWPITRALLEWLPQMHLTYSQMPVQEQAGQASVTTGFCFRSYTVRLLLCNLHPQHFRSHVQDPHWLTRASSSAQSPSFEQN